MAIGTTFLVGAIVGGGAKWAYDKWQARKEKPDLSETAVPSSENATAAKAEEAVEPSPA